MRRQPLSISPRISTTIAMRENELFISHPNHGSLNLPPEPVHLKTAVNENSNFSMRRQQLSTSLTRSTTVPKRANYIVNFVWHLQTCLGTLYANYLFNVHSIISGPLPPTSYESMKTRDTQPDIADPIMQSRDLSSFQIDDGCARSINSHGLIVERMVWLAEFRSLVMIGSHNINFHGWKDEHIVSSQGWDHPCWNELMTLTRIVE